MEAVLLEVDFDPQVAFTDCLLPHRELQDNLTRAVHERTNRTIGDLQINITESGIVLWGRTRAYYYKQLASQAVLSESTGFPVVNEIQVI
jgi:hypothetical protein